MTALDMVTQLVLPIVTVPTTRDRAPKHPGVRLVDPSVAIEIGLTTERATAGGTSRAWWSLLRRVEMSGIAIDSKEPIWGFGSRTPFVVEAICGKLALVAVAVGASGRRTHRIKAACRKLAWVAVAVGADDRTRRGE